MDNSNDAREVGEGSRSNLTDTFYSMLYPGRDTIEIPLAFLEDWKDTICAGPDACMKDPTDNFFHFDTRKTRVSNCIHGGLVVARKCGFRAPQRILFKYLPEYSQFNMTFVDGTGAEIPYLGLRYPIDQHQIRLADPTKSFMPQYFWHVPEDPDETPWVPIQYVVASFSHASLDDPADDPNEIPDAAEFPFQWEKIVSQAFAEGHSVLHFPAFVCNAHPNLNGHGLVVINQNTNDIIGCIIKKANRSRIEHQHKIEYHIGGDWYDFVKRMRLKKNDKLMFAMDDPPTTLRVRVVKL